MASALEKAFKGVLKKSESQKVFSPWWSDAEDKLLYAVMILGMITLPFNMVSNTTVECTPDKNSGGNAADEGGGGGGSSSYSEQKMMLFFLRKYCTVFFIHGFVTFLPFILILTPLPLVASQQMALRYFKVQRRMDQFYKLMVKDSLDREDVENMEKEKMRSSYEIVQLFRDSNGIYHSFISESVIQLILGAIVDLLLIWTYAHYMAPELLGCDYEGYHYICIVPLATFYSHILAVAIAAMTSYLLCNVYTLVWIAYPPLLDPFYKLMIDSMTHVKRNINQELTGGDDKEKVMFTRVLHGARSADIFFDVFFDKGSRDLGLLITLLACRHGIAEGLRFISIFDKDYQNLWKPVDMRVNQDPDREHVVNVEWNDAPLAAFVHKYHGRKLVVEYTVEIFPSATEGSLKNQVFVKDACIHDTFEDEKKSLRGNVSSSYKYRETFYGVDATEEIPAPRVKRPPLLKQFSIMSAGTTAAVAGDADKKKSSEGKSECKVTISCEVNGRTVAQRTEKVPPLAQSYEESLLLAPSSPLSPTTPKADNMTRMDSLSIVDEEDETDNNGHAGLRSQLERERERFFFHNGS